MNNSQLRNLSQRKYLGSHCHSHLPLAELNISDIKYELTHSKKIIENLCNCKITSVSYPYGVAQAINDSVIRIAKEAGYISGLTMNRALNSQIELTKSPLQLSRFDTNDVFGGKSFKMYEDYFNE